MNLNDSTLADLAVRIPAASRVFKRHGLDYCCSGHRPLEEACRARDVDPSLVLAELERETSTETASVPSFEGQPLGGIVDFILERYHATLKEEVPLLIAMAKRVELRHGDKETCPRGLSTLLERIHAELLEHMMKEERILFPMIKAGAGGGARGPISVMNREHEDHGAALRKIRELTTDHVPPSGACATWRAMYLRLAQLESDLMDHIHLENNVLFPRALRGE